MNLCRTGFLLLIASLTAAPLAAQPTSVAPGQTVAGRLEPGDARLEDGQFYDAYVIRGRPGDRVVVRMRSPDVGTHLQWVRDGAWEHYSSEPIIGESSYLRMLVTLGPEGAHELRAATRDPGEQGAYELQLTQMVFVPAGRIAVGQTVTGALTDDDYEGAFAGFEDHYRLEAEAGAPFTAQVESDGFAPILMIGWWEDGQFRIRFVDRDGTDTGTFLVGELSEAREHYLVVRSYTTKDTGSYTLRVLPGAVEP
jgi:hypothetical protein